MMAADAARVRSDTCGRVNSTIVIRRIQTNNDCRDVVRRPPEPTAAHPAANPSAQPQAQRSEGPAGACETAGCDSRLGSSTAELLRHNHSSCSILRLPANDRTHNRADFPLFQPCAGALGRALQHRPGGTFDPKRTAQAKGPGLFGNRSVSSGTSRCGCIQECDRSAGAGISAEYYLGAAVFSAGAFAGASCGATS